MQASQATVVAPVASGRRQVVADYVALTKPKVQSLLLLTTVCTMEIAGDPSVQLIALTVAGDLHGADGRQQQQRLDLRLRQLDVVGDDLAYTAGGCRGRRQRDGRGIGH